MTVAVGTELIVSADSHVMEPFDLWTKGLGQRFGDKAPKFDPPVVGQGFQSKPGGTDPHKRLEEMAADPGLSAEVLYPTNGLRLFSIPEADLQEACFRVYNDWLIDYCKIAGERLIGVAAISAYNIGHAVAELRRCRNGGLRGAEIWQAPPDDLPFYSDHYEPLWAALQELEMPLSLHILTGHSYFSKPRPKQGNRAAETNRGTVNLKLLDAANAVFDFVHYGILEKYPGLKLVIVENEIGWLPFLVQQWDYYFRRFRNIQRGELPIHVEPSFYVNRQVFATFFNDTVGGHNLAQWGQDNCMWSNDYPHENSTWPNSYQVIERDLGHLPADVRAKLVRENVVGLYNLSVAALMA
jgi:predicted TIM-barrel fold metal-dependent hydrolase